MNILCLIPTLIGLECVLCHEFSVMHILGLIYLIIIKHRNKGYKAYFETNHFIFSVKCNSKFMT